MGNRRFQTASLFQVTVGLTLGDGTIASHPLDQVAQIVSMPQQPPRVIEPLGFASIADARHLS
jgi:hypothetical protein